MKLENKNLFKLHKLETYGEVKDILGRLLKLKNQIFLKKDLVFLKGENATADYDRATRSYSNRIPKTKLQIAQKNNKSGKPLVIDSAFKEKIT